MDSRFHGNDGTNTGFRFPVNDRTRMGYHFPGSDGVGMSIHSRGKSLMRTILPLESRTRQAPHQRQVVCVLIAVSRECGIG